FSAAHYEVEYRALTTTNHRASKPDYKKNQFCLDWSKRYYFNLRPFHVALSMHPSMSCTSGRKLRGARLRLSQPEKFWTPTIAKGHCADRTGVTIGVYVSSAVQLALDWYYALALVPLVWRLQMRTVVKISTMFVLGVGVFSRNGSRKYTDDRTLFVSWITRKAPNKRLQDHMELSNIDFANMAMTARGGTIINEATRENEPESVGDGESQRHILEEQLAEAKSP
ncbi:hypothetical protein MPH_13542, partial [Macrophomina phaseolina MS6]